jgi:hypothetical protein
MPHENWTIRVSGHYGKSAIPAASRSIRPLSRTPTFLIGLIQKNQQAKAQQKKAKWSDHQGWPDSITHALQGSSLGKFFTGLKHVVPPARRKNPIADICPGIRQCIIGAPSKTRVRVSK